MVEKKNIEDIGDIGLHAKVSFDDELKIATVYYYRGEILIENELFEYDKFEDIFN